MKVYDKSIERIELKGKKSRVVVHDQVIEQVGVEKKKTHITVFGQSIEKIVGGESYLRNLERERLRQLFKVKVEGVKHV